MAIPRRLFPALLCAVLIVSACVPLDEGGITTSRRTQPSTADGGQTTSTTPADPVPGTNPPGTPAVLLTVFDGDSLEIEVDGRSEEVRLAGINTPEADECHGEAARNAMKELVENAELVLTEVDGEDDRDQFGRLLRNLWADGVWVSEHQVRNGHAIALQTGTPQETTLLDAEADAWENSRGLWALDACGDVPGDVALSVRIGDIRYDPPGRDFENKEEEFVSIVNEADLAIELTGWILRDESSRHRYVFPPIALDPGDALRVRTGCGDDRGRDLYWCADDAVWSNGGDTVILQNRDGTVIDRFKYEGDF